MDKGTLKEDTGGEVNKHTFLGKGKTSFIQQNNAAPCEALLTLSAQS